MIITFVYCSFHQGKYVILRELAGLGLRDIENDVRNECGASLVQSVYQSFLEMKRKTREVVLSSLEKDLKVKGSFVTITVNFLLKTLLDR